MRSTRLWIALGGCFFTLALLVWAQGRKPGLWEMTTTQSWQQSPFPAGMPNPMGSGPRTTQVCLTQQQIDKYGAIVPQQSQSHNCQVTNVVKKPNGMTADLECAGTMSGKGSIESSWTDPDHAKGKVHFTGEIHMGPNTKPVEWTAESTSVFKSADCGSVKPLATPDH